MALGRGPSNEGGSCLRTSTGCTGWVVPQRTRTPVSRQMTVRVDDGIELTTEAAGRVCTGAGHEAGQPVMTLHQVDIEVAG
jgi:hypothetical protein